VLSIYDSVQSKPISPIGWAARAYPPGNSNTAAYATAVNLAAVSGGNGGCMLIPIELVAPMLLTKYTVRSTDTANLRTAEARLYYSDQNNSATADFVTGSDSTWSFTPTVASNRTGAAVSGSPLLLPPGFYWLAIRNTSTAQTFGIGTTANTMGEKSQETKTIAALGSTLDTVTGWSTGTAAPGVLLQGLMPDGSTAW
jgi:hypothetical protein